MTKWAVVTDFDGTITLKDVSDALLVRFKAATKTEVAGSYDPSVKIDQWMTRYFEKLKADRAQIEDYVLKSTRLRNGFREFHTFCTNNNIPLEIASGGVDLYIKCLLKQWQLKIKAFHGRARFTTSGILVDYPPFKGASLDDFKAARVRHHQKLGRKVIFCGDGTSDLKAAKAADAVFATKKLRFFCQAQTIKHYQLKNFHQLITFLK